MAGWLIIEAKSKDSPKSVEICAYSRSSHIYELFWENLDCDKPRWLSQSDLNTLKAACSQEIQSWKDYIIQVKRNKDPDAYIAVRESRQDLNEYTKLLGILEFMDDCYENIDFCCQTT